MLNIIVAIIVATAVVSIVVVIIYCSNGEVLACQPAGCDGPCPRLREVFITARLLQPIDTCIAPLPLPWMQRVHHTTFSKLLKWHPAKPLFCPARYGPSKR